MAKKSGFRSKSKTDKGKKQVKKAPKAARPGKAKKRPVPKKTSRPPSRLSPAKRPPPRTKQRGNAKKTRRARRMEENPQIVRSDIQGGLQKGLRIVPVEIDNQMKEA